MSKQSVFFQKPGFPPGRLVLEAATPKDAAEYMADYFAPAQVPVAVWSGQHTKRPNRDADYEINNG